jgi:hypothetical protein
MMKQSMINIVKREAKDDRGSRRIKIKRSRIMMRKKIINRIRRS